MSNREQVVLNGRYELQRRVGRGGMAEVFLARDRLLDRPVAIKILFPEFATDPSFVARFRREAQSAANLNHPNITGVYDWGKERGTYYIVMEYVDGPSVSDILRAEGPIEPKRAAGIAASVAAALGSAHRNGVVHRDVKPGNVILTTTGEVKVADFGIARALTSSGEENLTQTGSVMGTATYFSPEQAQGRPVDPRSDLYSLGIVLYEMVAGKPPFTADSPVAIAYKHVQEPVPSLQERAPGVPAAYEAITLKALAKDVDARYQDAEELRADLLRFRDDRPVKAPGVLAGAAPAPGSDDPPTRATSVVPGPVSATATVPSEVDDDEEETPAPSRTGWFFVAIVILLAVLGGLLFAFANQLGIFDSQTVTVEVPTVTGLEQEMATKRLERRGFEVGPIETVASEKDLGVVAGQDPSGGTEAEEGATVTLQVSGGPATKAFPRLIGQTEKKAKRALDDAGFTGKVRVRKRAEADQVGNVVETTPSAGTDQSLNVAVVLVVGVAPATTTTTTRPPPPTNPPTTLPPATLPPTTLPPTTLPPTTLPPTTLPPTTVPPTLPPTTVPPTTEAPTTTTEAPTTTTTAPPTTTTAPPTP